MDNSPIYINNSLTTGIYSDPEQNLENQLSRFSFYSDDAIVMDPSQYYLSIQRAKIHTESIPMYIFPVKGYPNTDPNLSPFTVSFRYFSGNFDIIYTGSVIFQSQYIGFVPPLIGVKNVDLNNNDNLLYYSIYDVAQMLKIFNDSIYVIWHGFVEACTAQGVTIGSGFYPYYSYDYDNSLFSLNFYRPYFAQQTIPSASVFMYQDAVSADLFGVPSSYIAPLARQTPDLIYQMLCYDLINNGTGADNLYVQMSASQNQFNVWCPISRILFLIDVGVKLEYDITSTGQQNVAINNSQYLQKPERPLFFDILVDADEWGRNRNIINYSVSSIAESRMVGLRAGPPIKNFTIQVLWQDVYNNTHPIIGTGNTNNLIKLAFFKRSTMLL
jgi:hypothetical protein